MWWSQDVSPTICGGMMLIIIMNQDGTENEKENGFNAYGLFLVLLEWELVN